MSKICSIRAKTGENRCKKRICTLSGTKTWAYIRFADNAYICHFFRPHNAYKYAYALAQP
jgi:hypothetical protein